MNLRVTLVLSALAFFGCTERTAPEMPEGAPYGATCVGNADCASDACLMVAEPFCTQECIDDCTCPTGSACTTVGEGLSVCAPGENTCASTPDAGPPDTGGADVGPSDSGPPDTGPPDTGRPPVDSGTPVTPVDYDVTMRSSSLGAALSPVDGMETGGSNLTVRLPFDVQFFSETYRAGTMAVASWQGLFAFDSTGIMAFVPGNRTRYEIAAPLIVAHHFGNTSSSAGSVSYRVSGAAPNRALEIEWVTANLSGTGGARFRLRFDEGDAAFVIHYGPIGDDVFAEAWTQLAMLDTAQYEETVISTGSPTPASQANTEFTYSPR